MEKTDQFFYFRFGIPKGPFSKAEFIELAKNRKIKSNTKCMRNDEPSQLAKDFFGALWIKIEEFQASIAAQRESEVSSDEKENEPENLLPSKSIDTKPDEQIVSGYREEKPNQESENLLPSKSIDTKPDEQIVSSYREEKPKQESDRLRQDRVGRTGVDIPERIIVDTGENKSALNGGSNCSIGELNRASNASSHSRRLSKTVAILLCLFLGFIGMHHFYMGRTGQGFLYLIFCCTLIPLVVSWIELFKILFSSEREFQRMGQDGTVSISPKWIFRILELFS